MRNLLKRWLSCIICVTLLCVAMMPSLAGAEDAHEHDETCDHAVVKVSAPSGTDTSNTGTSDTGTSDTGTSDVGTGDTDDTGTGDTGTSGTDTSDSGDVGDATGTGSGATGGSSGSSTPTPLRKDDGQLIGLFDSTGTPIPTEDADGNPISRFDDNGDFIPPTDAEGNPIELFDETGKPIVLPTRETIENTQGEQSDENGVGRASAPAKSGFVPPVSGVAGAADGEGDDLFVASMMGEAQTTLDGLQFGTMDVACEHSSTQAIAGKTPTTCQDTGYSPHEVCNDCGMYLVDGGEWSSDKPVLSRDHRPTGKRRLVAAGDCWTKELYDYKCTWCTARCGLVEGEKVHKYAEATQWYYTFDRDRPTCTKTGSGRPYCPTPSCGALSGNAVTVPKLPHAYGALILDESRGYVAPTCTTDGEAYRQCTNCPALNTVPDGIDSPGHQWEEIEAAIAPSCVAGRTKIEKCQVAVCNAVRGGEEIAAVADHSFVPHLAHGSNLAATCTNEGVLHHICPECTSVEPRVTAMLAHTYVFTRTVPANSERDGYDLYSCADCDDYDHRNYQSYNRGGGSGTATATGVLGAADAIGETREDLLTNANWTAQTAGIESGVFNGKQTYRVHAQPNAQGEYELTYLLLSVEELQRLAGDGYVRIELVMGDAILSFAVQDMLNQDARNLLAKYGDGAKFAIMLRPDSGASNGYSYALLIKHDKGVDSAMPTLMVLSLSVAA